jgi:hypothetical protein
MARRSLQTAGKREREQAKRERRERKEVKKAARNAADAGWQIVKSGAVAPSARDGFDAAFVVNLVSGSSTREVVVEFEAPSAVASVVYAEEVTRSYLSDAEPPQHLAVGAGGVVRVISGPRTTARPAS